MGLLQNESVLFRKYKIMSLFFNFLKPVGPHLLELSAPAISLTIFCTLISDIKCFSRFPAVEMVTKVVPWPRLITVCLRQ